MKYKKSLFAVAVLAASLAVGACGSGRAANPSAAPAASSPIAASASHTSGEAQFCSDLQSTEQKIYLAIEADDMGAVDWEAEGETLGNDSLSTPWAADVQTAGQEFQSGDSSQITDGLYLLDGDCDSAGHHVDDQAVLVLSD